MKKAKALQDFNYGGEVVLKGDILEVHVTKDWFYHAVNSLIPAFIVENNPHIFECPYEEKLTSEQWDEKARGYMWVPKKGSIVFRINSSLSYGAQNWSGSMFDWFCFRCGMIFRRKAEAERAVELMKNGSI